MPTKLKPEDTYLDHADKLNVWLNGQQLIGVTLIRNAADDENGNYWVKNDRGQVFVFKDYSLIEWISYG